MTASALTKQLWRMYAIGGTVMGAVAVIFAGFCYVTVRALELTPNQRETIFAALSVTMVVSIFFLFALKWRTRSPDHSAFYAYGLREPHGKWWCFFRFLLWGSFILSLIELASLLRLPLAARADSQPSLAFSASLTFYFGALTCVANLFGVRALAVYRFFWHLAYGGPSRFRSAPRAQKHSASLTKPR